MHSALSHVLDQVGRFSAGRPAALVLITDAQVGNDGAIVQAMLKHPEVPVHCIGIDSSLNDALLADLVRQQGGTFHALQPTDDIPAVVAQIANTLGQPVLVDLQAPPGWEPAASCLPNLYAGQTRVVSLRTSERPSMEIIQLRARNRDGSPVTLDFRLADTHGEVPRLRWSKERLLSLVARNDNMSAIALSKETNILCPLTAYVTWDQREKVAIAHHTLVQPNMQAHYAVSQTCGLRSFAGKMDRNLAYKSQVRRSSAPEPMFAMESLFADIPSHFLPMWSFYGRSYYAQDFTFLLSKIRDWIDSRAQSADAESARADLNKCEVILANWIAIETRIAGSASRRTSTSTELIPEALPLREALRDALFSFVNRWVIPIGKRRVPVAGAPI
jgi:hypothetical protein